METYKIYMLFYAFLFFAASLTFIILGTNMTYEISTGRQEQRPASVQGDQWAVERVTKGHPPVKIATRTEWRQGTNDDYVTTYTREIHWSSILGVAAFSVFAAGVFIFIGAALWVAFSRIHLPHFGKPLPSSQ